MPPPKISRVKREIRKVGFKVNVRNTKVDTENAIAEQQKEINKKWSSPTFTENRGFLVLFNAPNPQNNHLRNHIIFIPKDININIIGMIEKRMVEVIKRDGTTTDVNYHFLCIKNSENEIIEECLKEHPVKLYYGDHNSMVELLMDGKTEQDEIDKYSGYLQILFHPNNIPIEKTFLLVKNVIIDWVIKVNKIISEAKDEPTNEQDDTEINLSIDTKIDLSYLDKVIPEKSQVKLPIVEDVVPPTDKPSWADSTETDTSLNWWN